MQRGLQKTCDAAVGGGRFVPVPPYTWYVLAVQGRANGVLALAQTMPSLAKLVEASMILCYSLQQSCGGGKWMMWGRKMLISACLCPPAGRAGLGGLGQAKCQLRNANRATNFIAGADVYLKALSAPGQKFYSFVLQTPRH